MIQKDYNIGDQIGPINYIVSKEDVIDFTSLLESNVSFQRFISVKEARKGNFPESIVPGNMHLILLSNFLMTSIKNIILKKMEIIFRHIVKQNIQLIIRGFITNVSYENNTKYYECDITIEDDQGISLVIANSKFTIK